MKKFRQDRGKIPQKGGKNKKRGKVVRFPQAIFIKKWELSRQVEEKAPEKGGQPMKEAPPFSKEGSTKEAQSQELGKCIKERFLEDLNRILNELPTLYVALSKAKRVQERQDANQRWNVKKQELERLVRGGMKDTGTAIVVYDKLSRLLNRTGKHAPTVQFMLLNGIEQDVRHSPLGGKE